MIRTVITESLSGLAVEVNGSSRSYSDIAESVIKVTLSWESVPSLILLPPNLKFKSGDFGLF